MRQAALLVVVVCVLAVPVVGAAGVDGPPAGRAMQDDASLTDEGVDITVQVESDGSAQWNISTAFALEDENDTEAFERLRDEFEAYETDSEFSVGVFRSVAPEVSERAGRSMEIRNADRSSRIVDHGNNSTGVLTIEFTWTNFTRVENETLVVDSFSGSWFGDLRDGQTLTIRPPDGYDTTSVEPAASITGGAYEWTGPQAFSAGEPTVVFTEGGGPGPVGVSMEFVAAVGMAALLLGVVLAWAYYRELPGWLPGGTTGASTETSGDGGAATDGAPSGSESGGTVPQESTVDDAPVGGTAGGAAAGAAENAVDTELLSDEERVERLLDEHGGRMKQSRIVEETRWSTAKVSQLLSSMADDDRVEKLRIGRENLISLPGEGIDDEQRE